MDKFSNAGHLCQMAEQLRNSLSIRVSHNASPTTRADHSSKEHTGVPSNVARRIKTFSSKLRPPPSYPSRCMECLAPHISLREAMLTSITFTSLYVLSLYLPFNTGPRNTRSIILSRVATLAILATLLELYTRHRIPAITYKLSSGTRIPALIAASVLTLLLYAGHLAVTPPNALAHYSLRDASVRYVALRNYVFGPVLEEVVFRRQTMLIWSCQDDLMSLIFPALMFALAHVHHVGELGVVGLLFQMAYTFLFGVYAAALYRNTRTFWAPFVAHVICNVLELPDFARIAQHPRRRRLVGFYAFSLAVFAVAFQPLTRIVQPYQLAVE